MNVQILNTTDYSKFKTIEGNREVDQPHVRQLAEEIALNDLTPYFPVLINEGWEIIDGQHRFSVCQQLGLPVYYLQVPGLDLTSVQRINTTSKRWTLRDYIKSYIQKGVEDYSVLLRFSERTGINFSISAALLMGLESIGGGARGNNDAQRVGSIIKEGRFKVSDRTHAEDMALLLKSLTGHTDFDPTKERSLVFALNRISKIERFDSDRLLGKLRDRNLKIDRQTTTRFYLIELERVYNHGSQIRVDLFTGEETRS
ncbi:hypothetical protein SAMN05445060_2793 [Williamsia sterculiae]|uniref:ParB-like nuclease domain-containing protein n=2 Tax=Williamsia sterculiae TaxID=1344003 RepID=A0A1N7GHJ6_9NOCA|nr:hypothetical protein SAMN05445060_2793 [Williamsia sterculiae]